MSVYSSVTQECSTTTLPFLDVSFQIALNKIFTTTLLHTAVSFLSGALSVHETLLTRLLEHVVDLVLPESQCGFRRGRSTIDMIFGARQLQEKCCEQHQDLFLAFVDLTNAFDTVNQDLLWNILRKFGCPPTFIAILQQFHTGMCAQVVMAGSQSSSFPVEVGVKQGCVLAPIIFNLLLVAITFVSHRDL